MLCKKCCAKCRWDIIVENIVSFVTKLTAMTACAYMPNTDDIPESDQAYLPHLSKSIVNTFLFYTDAITSIPTSLPACLLPLGRAAALARTTRLCS